MFPLRDSTPRQRFPIINYLIILLNLGAFFAQLTAPSFERFIFEWGFIPAQFSFLNPYSYIFIVSSMFLHGRFFHILSNLWFLHVFGDNVEDQLGHVRYILFYVLAGFFAVMAQYVLMTQSEVPLVGASGAISGVAGAYYVFFKRSQVKTLVTLFFFWTIIELPSTIVLGYWFVTQIFAGIGSLASFNSEQGGVAFFAHIGGFIFGYIFAKSIQKNIAHQTGQN